MAILESVVKNKLTDPDSAQFRRLTLYADPESSKSLELCGEFNAKNRMGGYMGYTGFEASGYFATPQKLADGLLMSSALIEDIDAHGNDKAFLLAKKSRCTGTIVTQKP